MSDRQLTTPVVLVIFNRPATTARVFNAIRQARPSRLFVIADGPRLDHPDEAEMCAAARAIVEVDWDCVLEKNYAENNMGCDSREPSGLQWVFEQVEEAIILEDDCLPHPTFFRFCQELLQTYRDDQRVMLIAGTNALQEWKSDQQSYHFSVYGGIGGWASWRRAWQHFDPTMELWSKPEVRQRIRDVLIDKTHYQFRERVFWDTYHGRITAWDYPWSFARLLHSGLSIVPSVNLVSNIGYGEGATHTKFADDLLANLPTSPMSFPLTKVAGLSPDREFDRKSFQLLHPYQHPVLRVLIRVARPVLPIIKKIIRKRS